MTLGLEALVVLVLVRRRPDRRTVLRTACALNLCTHPLATLAAWYGHAGFVALEVMVVLAEALGYATVARQPWPRACLLALAANAATAALALVADAAHVPF